MSSVFFRVRIPCDAQSIARRNTKFRNPWEISKGSIPRRCRKKWQITLLSQTGNICRHLMWLIGDWLLAGETSGYLPRGKLDEACKQFGIAYETARASSNVCKAVERDIRISDLTCLISRARARCNFLSPIGDRFRFVSSRVRVRGTSLPHQHNLAIARMIQMLSKFNPSAIRLNPLW